MSRLNSPRPASHNLANEDAEPLLASDSGETTKVLLVGAGPIGIEVAAALRSAGIDYIHVEAGDVASTIGWYAPGTSIFSSPERIAVAGIPFATYPSVKATREDYLNYLRSVVRGLGLPIRQQTRLLDCDKTSEGFDCTLSESDWSVGGPQYSGLDEFGAEHRKFRIRCRAVVLAIGDMHLPRLVGVPGESSRHVTHFMPDLHTLFGKRVVIVGGKNSAAEAVVRLARINEEMVVIHRGEGFETDRVKPWLLPEIRSLIADGRVRFFAKSHLKKIESKKAWGESEGESEQTVVPFDHLLLLTGYDQDSTLFERIGLELQGANQTPILNPATMESTVPGVYVAGTATAGSQRGGAKVFIENCHVHAQRIVDHLLGRSSQPVISTDRAVIHREL